MTMQDVIESKLTDDLQPTLLLAENESHMHSGPATESHFKITAVSEVFDEMSLVKRHQHVYGILKSEMQNSIHALALHLYTPAEWKQRHQASPTSPDCHGGSK